MAAFSEGSWFAESFDAIGVETLTGLAMPGPVLTGPAWTSPALTGPALTGLAWYYTE